MPEELIQWDKLTPEERNMLIHTRVMGLPVQVACLAPVTWQDDPINTTPRGSWYCQRGHYGVFRDTTHYMPAVPLQYSESMDAAWLVLQKVADRWDEKAEYLDEVFYQFQHELLDDSGGEIWTSYELMARMAKWTPETVCIAALKAVGCTFAEDEEE